jgi:cytochrome c556
VTYEERSAALRRARSAAAALGSACLCAGMLAAAGCGSEAKGRSPHELSPQEKALADVVERRRANLKDMGAAFKAIRDVVESGQSDPTLVKYSAKTVRGYAQQLEGWFPAGSGPALGVETQSRPEIWTSPDDFRAATRDFDARAQALLEAAAQPDRAALEARFRAAGEACKSCHDRFRIDAE